MNAKPLRVVPSAAPSAQLREPRPRGSARVLIVDDRSTARILLEGLARTLEPGVMVESFADPEDALAQKDGAAEVTRSGKVGWIEAPGVSPGASLVGGQRNA